jgi:U3 small nucleolar RNA-associated protein 13
VCFASAGSQVVTGGSDGMVKVWTVRTMESCTVDGHEDKVWGLAVMPDGRVVSGGGDRVNVWKDNGEELAAEKEREREADVLGEQDLANAIRAEDWGAALEKAMAMEKPETTLKVINDMRAAGHSLDLHVRAWEAERVSQILRYARAWNSRALNCGTAMFAAQAVVKNRDLDELAAMPEVVEYAAAMKAYAQRHFDRLEGLMESSYAVDFMSQLMGGMEEGEGAGAGAGEDVVGGIQLDEDVEVKEWEKKRLVAVEKIEGVAGKVAKKGLEGAVEIIGFSSDEEDDDLMNEDKD